MKFPRLQLAFIFLLLTLSLAQWAPLVNDSQANYVNYGNFSTGYPGPRALHTMVRDTDPNFLWVGFGLCSAQSSYNDLWKYDISSKQWAWMAGDPNCIIPAYVDAIPPYLNITGSSTGPIARATPNVWVDSNYIWLYGGQTVYTGKAAIYNSDFWKFDINAQQWIWISGIGNNDSQIIPQVVDNIFNGSTPIHPGAISSSVTWIDSNGDFFMFGGVGAGGNIIRPLDNIWKYSKLSGQWTFIGGSAYNNYSRQWPSYGVKGIANSTNWPPARSIPANWYFDDTLYIFGGQFGGPLDSMNDLWMYANGIWTWLSGNKTINVPTIEVDLGYWSDRCEIGARLPAAFWRTDDRLWIFGGLGSQDAQASKNDIWVYSISKNKWAWLHNTTQVETDIDWPKRRDNAGNIEVGDTHVIMYAGGRVDNTFIGDTWVFNKSYYTTIVDAPPPPPPPAVPKKKPNLAVPIAVPIVVVFVVAAAAIFAYWFKNKRKFSKNIEMMQYEVDMEIAAKNRITFSKHGNTLENIEIDELIGTGNFGEVYRGTWHNTPVAFKKLKPEFFSLFKKEADTLLKLRHPQIVQYLGIHKAENNQYFIVMELMNCGDLQKMLQTGIEISDEDLLSMAVDAASGLAYIHSNNLIHRDCALRNLLTSRLTTGSKKYSTKISDFGMATLVSETYYQSENRLLPYKWASVEIIKFGKYSTASDVWAFGVTLWELFSLGSLPFTGQSNAEATEGVLAGKRLSKPTRCPDTVFAIMERCWLEKTKERPTMMEVYETLKQLEQKSQLSVVLSSSSDTFYTSPNTFYKS